MNKNKRTKTFLRSLLLIVLVLIMLDFVTPTHTTYAQAALDDKHLDSLKNLIDSDGNPMKGSSIDTIGGALGVAWNIVFGIGLALSTIALMVSGIKFVTSRGDPKALDTSRKHLTYSVIGFVLTLGAITLFYIISTTLGAVYPLQPKF